MTPSHLVEPDLVPGDLLDRRQHLQHHRRIHGYTEKSRTWLIAGGILGILLACLSLAILL